MKQKAGGGVTALRNPNGVYGLGPQPSVTRSALGCRRSALDPGRKSVGPHSREQAPHAPHTAPGWHQGPRGLLATSSVEESGPRESAFGEVSSHGRPRLVWQGPGRRARQAPPA